MTDSSQRPMTNSAIRVFIREAEENDLPALEWEGQFSHYRRLYRHAMNEARRGRRVLLVAEADEKLVGQIFIQFSSGRSELADGRKTGYLYSFRVRPDYRGQGIGTALMEQAEEALRSQAFERAVIAVARDNDGAQKLYSSRGYIRFSEDPGQWSYIDQHGDLQQVDEPAYLYQKQLRDHR